MHALPRHTDQRPVHVCALAALAFGCFRNSVAPRGRRCGYTALPVHPSGIHRISRKQTAPPPSCGLWDILPVFPGCQSERRYKVTLSTQYNVAGTGSWESNPPHAVLETASPPWNICPYVEHRTGLEPVRPAWKAGMLPTTSAVRVPPRDCRTGKKEGVKHNTLYLYIHYTTIYSYCNTFSAQKPQYLVSTMGDETPRLCCPLTTEHILPASPFRPAHHHFYCVPPLYSCTGN